MEGKNLTSKNLFIMLLASSFIFSQVTIEIKNIDETNKTLDVHMTNPAGCSSCNDSTYTNKSDCLNYGFNSNDSLTAQWTFDTSVDATSCGASIAEGGKNGRYFDGKVNGFQFFLTGIDITGLVDADGASISGAAATGGSAESSGFTMNTSQLPSGNTAVLGFTLTGASIEAGNDQLLFQLAYSSKTANVCVPVQYGCGDGAATENDLEALDNCSQDLNDGEATAIDAGDDNPVISATTLTDCGATNNQPCALDVTIIDGCGLDIYQTNSYVPENFSVSQNYPNPFNPVTSISFDVATMDNISLKVYDLAGREVATLVSGNYTPGHYIVEWNASKLSSGMYIYRFTNSNQSITRKMLYLK